MKYQCPVCGYYTFEKPALGKQGVCPVCCWEDNVQQYQFPMKKGKSGSLLDARRNYKAFGSCTKETQAFARPPKQEELNGIKWENPYQVELAQQDTIIMRRALELAQKAAAIEEVPIGCVITYEGSILSETYNMRNTKKMSLAHAEIMAIREACEKMKDWRLDDCTMYITLEPCQMCAGAIVQARIPRVVIGAKNKKAGCAGSIINLLQMKEFNHQVELVTGVLEEECSQVMKGFFKQMRQRRKNEKD